MTNSMRITDPFLPGLFGAMENRPQMTQELTSLKQGHNFHLSSNTEPNRVLRALVTLVAIGAIVTYGLWVSGHLTSLPDHLWQFMTSWQAAVTGATLLGVLISTGIVMRHVTKGQGHFFQHHSLTPTVIAVCKKTEIQGQKTLDESMIMEGYIDTSCSISQDKDVSQKVYRVFGAKGFGDNACIGAVVLPLIPLEGVGSLIYRTLRAVTEPLELIADACYSHKKIPSIKHLPYALVISLANRIWDIVRVPFYTLAMMLGELYVFIDPIHGRKLVHLIEASWGSSGVTVKYGIRSNWVKTQPQQLHESIWSAECVGSTCSCEVCFPCIGNFWSDVYQKFKAYGPHFALPGCYYPVAYVEVNEENTIQAAWQYNYFKFKRNGKILEDQKREGQYLPLLATTVINQTDSP